MDKSKLYEGLWTSREIAEWFGIAASTFSTYRKKWLGLLERYMDVEEIGKGKYLLSFKKEA